MTRTQSAATKPSAVSRALARDRLGVPAVLGFVLAGVAPLTVAAGVIPTAYATTGLTAIPAAFVVIAVILGLFAAGYVAMARHVTNSGAIYAFVARGIGRPAGVAAALVALVAYTFLQVGLYGALGPAAAGEAAAHLGVHAPWWQWALGAWAVITVLGLLRVDITGWVLGILLSAEILVIAAETLAGLAHPAAGRLSFATLSPAGLTTGGFGAFGVLAVVAVLGFVGFEQAPVLGEEARNAKRTIPMATYLALGVIAIVYAGAAWAMAAHTGDHQVVAAAVREGPGLLFGLGGGPLPQAAQVLFMTSLFAAALAFHNCTWRYAFALGREGVLPAALGRTGGNNIPKAASLTQSLTGLATITIYAATGLDPMARLFFWLGGSGGFGIVVLLTVTAVAVIAFFARDPHGENTWRRLAAPALAAVLLAGIVVLAVRDYHTLLGVAPGDPAAWALPATYAVAAAVGLGWGLALKLWRPRTYAAIGLGPPRRHRPAHPHHRNNLVMTPEPSPADGSLSAVVPASMADVDVLSDVITEAFHPLAPSEWLIPDETARRAIFPGYFRLYVEHALASGVVHTTPDRAAAALWLPVGPDGPPLPYGYAERLATATGPWAHRFRAFDAALDSRHPAGISHRHLAILAVHPDQQGQGIGTALLRAYHHILDYETRLSAYLEASDLRTRQLYLRHGYNDKGEPVRLPDGPGMFPMWREPQPAALDAVRERHDR